MKIKGTGEHQELMQIVFIYFEVKKSYNIELQKRLKKKIPNIMLQLQ